MSLLTVAGTYDDGKIALAEQPEGVAHANVLVTFLHEGKANAAQQDKRKAGQRLLAQMKRGLDFGGANFQREELYADRFDQLETRRNRH